jgi:hypothetical protein
MVGRWCYLSDILTLWNYSLALLGSHLDRTNPLLAPFKHRVNQQQQPVGTQRGLAGLCFMAASLPLILPLYCLGDPILRDQGKMSVVVLPSINATEPSAGTESHGAEC